MNSINWGAVIATSLTALVGLTCAIVALTIGRSDPAAMAILMGIAGTALGSFLPQAQKLGQSSGFSSPAATANAITSNARKPDGGGIVGDLLITLAGGLLLMAVIVTATVAFARCAHAQDGDHPVAAVPAVDGDHPAPQALNCFDKGNTWCLVAASALGWQLNLKTAETQNGVALFGVALQHEFGSLPLAVGIYGGIGASTATQKSYQGCVGVSVTSWGLACLGPARITYPDGYVTTQAMLTLAGQLTFGGTPSYVRASARSANVSGL